MRDDRDYEFGRRDAIRIAEWGLLAREVFVIDRNSMVRYRQLVSEVTHEPDYDAVLQAVRAQLH